MWKQFNLEQDPQARNAVQAAGPTGPRDHTSLRLGAFYYYGRNALNADQTLFPVCRQSRSRSIVWGETSASSTGSSNSTAWACTATMRITARRRAKTDGYLLRALCAGQFQRRLRPRQYWFYPWLIGIMRYDIVNSPTDFQAASRRTSHAQPFEPGRSIPPPRQHQGSFRVPAAMGSAHSRSHSTSRLNGFVTGVDIRSDC